MKMYLEIGSMDYVKVLFSSVASLVTLFALTKIMGYKQMSQLSMFDYITGITIGSIASEVATLLEGDIIKPLIAMMVYGICDGNKKLVVYKKTGKDVPNDVLE